MPWFKVDDRLHTHPKWLASSPRARALWCSAGSWCAAMTTEGVVPRHVLATLGGRTRDADELVTVGLWHAHPDGWVFHDWLHMQPSAAQVEADRAAARERQRRAREKASASRRDSSVTHAEVTPVVTVPPTRPVPTPPLDGSCTTGSPPLAEPNPDATKLPPEQVASLLTGIEQARQATHPTLYAVPQEIA